MQLTETEIETEAVDQALTEYAQEPNLFMDEVLGVDLENFQQRIVKAVFEHERVAISACHDVGKTFTLSRVILAFGTIFPFSKIITTAPTGRQVKHILWSEIRTGHSRAIVPLGGKMLTTEWQISPDGDWFALGFSPQKEASGLDSEGQGTQSSFQGFHPNAGDAFKNAPHILVVFDEATGIPKQIWDMAEGLLTSAHVRFVCIGNPTSSQSEFAKCFKSKSWYKIKLSCFDSPNLIANGITDMAKLKAELATIKNLSDDDYLAHIRAYKVVKPHLLTLSWVVEKAFKWGIEHPLFLGKVLGEFPTESENVKMSLGLIEQAQRVVYTPSEVDLRLVGVDCARYGSDSTVFTYLHGKHPKAAVSHSKKDTTETTGELINFCKANGWPNVIVIDETGIGGAIVDNMRQAQRDGTVPRSIKIMGVHFGGNPVGRNEKESKELKDEEYVNLKAQLFDELAEGIKDGLGVFDEDIYLEELPTILYKYDSKGRLYIESKDEYKKRTGRGSPDHADSLGLAWFGRHFAVAPLANSTKPVPNRRIKALTANIRSRGNRW